MRKPPSLTQVLAAAARAKAYRWEQMASKEESAMPKGKITMGLDPDTREVLEFLVGTVEQLRSEVDLLKSLNTADYAAAPSLSPEAIREAKQKERVDRGRSGARAAPPHKLSGATDRVIAAADAVIEGVTLDSLEELRAALERYHAATPRCHAINGGEHQLPQGHAGECSEAPMAGKRPRGRGD